MLKYVKDIQEDGLCKQVGTGTNSRFYESIGMVQKDVEKSEIDNQWYLKELCPHYTEEEISQQKENQLIENEVKSIEISLNELRNLYIQAQIIGDSATMEDVTAQTKELLGITDEQESSKEDNSDDSNQE